MPATASASVSAGKYIYLFFNHDNSDQIDFWKIDQDNDTPEKYHVNIDNRSDISNGGAIGAVHISSGNRDEVHLFYIGKQPDKNLPILKEAMLANASKDGTPGQWVTQSLDKKKFPVVSDSFLCSTVDVKGHPRVFFTQPTDSAVHYAYWRSKEGQQDHFDWVETSFTGDTVAWRRHDDNLACNGQGRIYSEG